jgi:hypothetical protein
MTNARLTVAGDVVTRRTRSRRRTAITQAEITRAVKGAVAAGLPARALWIEVNPERGTIVLAAGVAGPEHDQAGPAAYELPISPSEIIL